MTHRGAVHEVCIIGMVEIGATAFGCGAPGASCLIHAVNGLSTAPSPNQVKVIKGLITISYMTSYIYYSLLPIRNPIGDC